MWSFCVNTNLRKSRLHFSPNRSFYQFRKNGFSESEIEEYSNKPHYQPIQDISSKARKQNETVKWYEKIKLANTVEEKIIAVNMPRYYGHKVVHLRNEVLPYNVLPAIQYYTRTLFNILPLKEDEKLCVSTPIVEKLESDVQDCIVFCHSVYRNHPQYLHMNPKEKDYELGRLIVTQISRILINTLSADYNYLCELEIDHESRHEAFWYVDGLDPPKNIFKSKEGREWQKNMKSDAIGRLMHFEGKPYLCLRHKKQLSPWQNFEIVPESNDKQINPYKWDPRCLGYSTKNIHVTSIPGNWPGCKAAFGNLLFCPRHFLTSRPTAYGEKDRLEALHAQAIQSSFAWLVSLAAHNGFNTFNDLTYPMNTQTVVTNGRDWSFYEYQLNTMLLSSEKNAKQNYCRGSAEICLYKEVTADGKCIGFNNDVLHHLVNFLVNIPTLYFNKNLMQPYLNDNFKLVRDYKDDEKCIFLENVYKHTSSNRGRHLAEPEIYLWEKIYKIDHKTRSMEPRRRFFEIGVNPWNRALDQHQKEYIPKCKRVNGPKDKKNKWKETFYS